MDRYVYEGYNCQLGDNCVWDIEIDCGPSGVRVLLEGISGNSFAVYLFEYLSDVVIVL